MSDNTYLINYLVSCPQSYMTRPCVRLGSMLWKITQVMLTFAECVPCHCAIFLSPRQDNLLDFAASVLST